MKNLNFKALIGLNDQNKENEKTPFTIDDLLTMEELRKVKGGEGDDDTDPIIIGGPK